MLLGFWKKDEVGFFLNFNEHKNSLGDLKKTDFQVPISRIQIQLEYFLTSIPDDSDHLEKYCLSRFQIWHSFSVVVYYGGSESQIFFTSYNYKYDCACSIVVQELDNKKKLISFEIGLKALKVLF